MTVSNAEEFLNRLTNDPNFRQQFKDLKSPDLALQAAKDAGYDFTPDEIRSVMQNKGIATSPQPQTDAVQASSAADAAEPTPANVMNIVAACV